MLAPYTKIFNSVKRSFFSEVVIYSGPFWRRQCRTTSNSHCTSNRKEVTL